MVPKGPYLDFEQPVIELAQRIEDIMKNTNATSSDVKDLISKKEKLQKKIQKKLSPWDKVELARRAGRPYTLDYANNMLEDFIEIHGDRCYSDDPAIVTGLAKLNGNSVLVIGHQKGRDTQESIKRNFGMSHPEGYRKAARALKLAERFNIPVICFNDTPGAYPGIGAEERGQAQAIAENLKIMSTLEVPIIVVVIGEGASGGALGIGVGDRLLMLENACYYVITPEGCAAILWGDSAKKKDVSAVMKLTSDDLKNLNVIDKIIPEPLGGAHWNPDEMYTTLKKALIEELNVLKGLEKSELVEKRIEKYASMGIISE
jgi:acetyl-CoA carboxylase carboxyl transferase subunit alpha